MLNPPLPEHVKVHMSILNKKRKLKGKPDTVIGPYTLQWSDVMLLVIWCRDTEKGEEIKMQVILVEQLTISLDMLMNHDFHDVYLSSFNEQ